MEVSMQTENFFSNLTQNSEIVVGSKSYGTSTKTLKAL